jgi:hypothetical protein
MRRHDSDRPSDFPPEHRPLYTRAEQALRRRPFEREMYRGDTFSFLYQIRHRPPTLPCACAGRCDCGVPQNVAGWTVWFTAKYNLGDPDDLAAVSLSTLTSGIVLANVPLGTIQVTVPTLATYAFPGGRQRLMTTIKSMDLSGNLTTEEVGTLDVWQAGVAAI